MTSDELDDWRKASRRLASDSDDTLCRELKSAIREDRWLEFVYMGGTTPGNKRRVKPLELFKVDGYTEVYLRAYCSTRKEERIFRLDRIRLSTDSSGKHHVGPAPTVDRPKQNKDRISELLASKPGLRSKQIAQELGIERTDVNSILYGELRHKFKQDQDYQWWPQELATTSRREAPKRVEIRDSLLARLCRYYLDCLSQDREDGISVFASSNYQSDYVELEELPQLSRKVSNIFEDDSARQLLNRMRRDRGRLIMYVGYPVRLRWVRGRRDWKVDPVFLFTLQQDPSRPNQEPSTTEDLPFLNFSVLKSLADVGSGNLTDEAIQLSEQLGLAGAEGELPEIDELFLRLQACRPNWDWIEDVNPYAISKGPPLVEIKEQGIYNRVVLVIGERSPYTQGLETELANLETTDERGYLDTALGTWLRGNILDDSSTPRTPILEILPLNSEQREAVIRGLSQKLTVITGPPGTGKSQVVASLLINAAWQGKKVLFASKNNKAVDVVETRVNALGPRPVLLRLGRDQYQKRLADYLISILSASATTDDEQNYNNHLRVQQTLYESFSSLEQELSQTIKFRNEIDILEQTVRHAEDEFGESTLRKLTSIDIEKFGTAATELDRATNRADYTQQTLATRILWAFLKGKRIRALINAGLRIPKTVPELGLDPPTCVPTETRIDLWRNYCKSVARLASIIRDAQSYFNKLRQLRDCKAPDVIAIEWLRLIQELSENSVELWNYWLRLQPSRMTSDEKTVLGEYTSLLQMIISANENEDSLDRKVFRRYYRLFPKITNLLPCWAVTSLSVRNRVPFESCFFDIVVVDEASQCDIASALPLLYRAKRAVIIGDPHQLKHISSVNRQQDRQLLTKHNLVEGHASWAYSVNSLFDRASRLCDSKDIIDLRDHHRSHKDIIDFSNEHFYNGRLRVATRYENLTLLSREDPAIRWIDTTGNVSRPSGGGAINETEAKAVVAELQRLVKQGYSGSIGVVSPFRAQANRIRDLVNQDDRLSTRLVDLEFLANTVHKFQGDEREVMLFSPVVSKGIQEKTLVWLQNNRYLFNVAVTRARSALIVVGDYAACRDSSVEHLAKYALYVRKLREEPGAAQGQPTDLGPEYPCVAKPDLVSDWERIFYQALYTEGIHPIPQYEEDQYILDFALFDGERKLDIEVDGEYYHRNWDGDLCRRDQIRNQRLIELGWDVMRFWVYQIRDDMGHCTSRVRAWLESKHR
jgi:very-short-patch-repair endonuclease